MILYLVGLLLVVAGISLSAATPQWPDCYKASGVIRLPYAEINEPFTGYFEGKKSRSRVDYYGDLVQTYQIGGDGTKTFEGSYKIAPVTTEEKVNVRTCFFNEPVSLQDLLPDITGFQLIGYKLVDGRNCSLWQNVTKVWQKKSVYNMFLSVDKNEPVRYEMLGTDTLFGSFYDRYYVDYTVFTALPSLPDEIFKTPDISTCHPVPMADSHCLSMNPIREYIHPHDSSCHVDGLFQSFKEKHGKDYAGETEHVKRKHIFHNNLRFIHSKNRAALGYTLAVNHMADFTEEEMRMMVRGRLPATENNGGIPFDKSKYIGKDLPDHVDWRLSGAVTPVKDQGICGSCWSFSTTGTIEGAYFFKTGELVRLSQQELVDCSWGEGNYGCFGGYPTRAYNWIMKHGLASEEEYGPYLAQEGLCHSKDVKPTALVKSFVNVTSGDIEALRMAVANIGPISVAIDANHLSFFFYSNGVYYEPECGNTIFDLDHAVLAVGYGVLNGKAFWLVKNEWSTYWGNDGYILMSQKDNNCGVATLATYVVL